MTTRKLTATLILAALVVLALPTPGAALVDFDPSAREATLWQRIASLFVSFAAEITALFETAGGAAMGTGGFTSCEGSAMTTGG